jgi:Mlc titration factor MtfA (ptsG expression regulator)
LKANKQLKVKQETNLLFIIPFSIFIGALLMRLVFPIFWRKYARKQRIKAALLLIDSRGDEFDMALKRYNRFYRQLSEEGRKRFLHRTVEFMRSKQFIYYELEKDDKIALLVSAAAIQITFGLDHYLLEYFEKIHILRNDYHYGGYKMAFMGHVNRNGIYFSWYNFLKGLEDASDAQNVGLHEMAHALAYVNFIAKTSGEDLQFKKRFEDFSKVARPIFNSMQAGATNALDKYAATDFQEFWAVSIETFFEKPKEVKLKMPELYTAMATLLNLDPLATEVILKAVA